MTSTLEQRVAALESGELERLRGLAQRRLERLRQERAAVADLRERLEDATRALAVLSAKYAEIAAPVPECDGFGDRTPSDPLDPLRAVIGAPAGVSVEYVVSEAVRQIKQLRQLLGECANHAAELGLLRVTVQSAPDATPHEVIADVIDCIKQLRKLVDDEREESAKEIGRLCDELSDTRSRLKDALEELAEARAELAKAKAPPVDDRLGWFNR